MSFPRLLNPTKDGMDGTQALVAVPKAAGTRCHAPTAACLRERLAGLEASAAAAATSGRKSTSACLLERLAGLEASAIAGGKSTSAFLRERLAGLEASAAAAAAPGRKSTSVIRSLFSRPFNAAAAAGGPSGSAAPGPPSCRTSGAASPSPAGPPLDEWLAVERDAILRRLRRKMRLVFASSVGGGF